ncbi:GNAT family N-acetyltransferase [Porticoccus sp.]|uniref:GNAT family N-acetyltransferase n=1 Tax=Porticoccus sp. TaxID=2024853 RepID=UPI0025F9CC78|nr:GNAT family N-acetyltransferase [Porticoccus sp.]|tara:strand:+ start:46445 stop:47026 length:582 start_codon:yes stop_codon:yes gene_type:complete
MNQLPLSIRPVSQEDLSALLRLENKCFTTDQLSRRSFRHWIQAENCAFIVAEYGDVIVGYSLIIFFKGTTLARLYSIATDPDYRGRGIARTLMEAGEQISKDAGRVFLRLEVSVDNTAGIALYESMGYQPFGIYRHYYENSDDALRMQKCIRAAGCRKPGHSLDTANNDFYLWAGGIDDGHARAVKKLSTDPA